MNIINNKRLPFSLENDTLQEYLIKEIGYIRNFRRRDFFYADISLMKIGKYLLDDFINIDTFNSDFHKVKLNFEEVFKDKEYPHENEEEFYKYILKEYLNIVSLPYSNFVYLLFKTQRYLVDVRIEIKKLESKISNYSDKKFREVEDRYEQKHICYYLSKNRGIQDKILEFMTNGIYDKAYEYSQNTVHTIKASLNIQLPLFNNTREFYFMQTQYIENFNPILYRFGFLPVGSVENFTQIYEDDKVKFLDILENNYQDTIDDINAKIDKNHILYERKSIFSTIFKHFKNNDFISINNMLPLQIEGLFYDFSLLLGISKQEIETSSMNVKLDKLQDKDNQFILWNYEYFAFVFPIIRNKVAHGRYLDDNDKLQAYFLLYDFYSIILLIIDDKIMLNQYVKYLNSDISNHSILKLYDFKGIVLDKFYSEEIQLVKIKDKVMTDEFYSYLLEEINKTSLDKIDKLKEQIIHLKTKFKLDNFSDLLTEISQKNILLKKEKQERKKVVDKFLKQFKKKAI